MFKRNHGQAHALASLGGVQRIAFIASAIGAIFPVLFLPVIRPVYWLAAFQLACMAVFAYIRWRTPAFRGSLIVVVLAAVGCLAAIMARLAA